MDNPETQVADNPVTQQAAPGAPFAAPEFQWKSQLPADLANSPTMQKFPDTKDGFSEAVKSHLSLEQLLGHEKVPVPKGPDDKEGWARFSKAMGIPDKADQYGLPDVQIPAEMKGLNFNKQEFAEMAHALKMTPSQTKALWETYTRRSIEEYGRALKQHEEAMIQVRNRLRGEWGDAYDSNVELGQAVINQFTDDQETRDMLTATFTKDPRLVKFLSKVGNQFAENKIGSLGAYKKFSLTADEAQSQIDAILRDEKHPYNNDRVSTRERDAAIDLVNNLYAVIQRSKGQA